MKRGFGKLHKNEKQADRKIFKVWSSPSILNFESGPVLVRYLSQGIVAQLTIKCLNKFVLHSFLISQYQLEGSNIHALHKNDYFYCSSK